MSINVLINISFYTCSFLFFILLAFEFARQIRLFAQIFAIQRHLKKYGKLVIVDSFELLKESWGRGKKYFVVYQFEDLYSSKQEISNSHYISLKQCENPIIEICYLPFNPEISRLAGQDKDNIDRDFAIIISILFGILLLPTIPVICLLWMTSYRNMMTQLRHAQTNYE